MNLQSIMLMQSAIKQATIQGSARARTDGEVRVLKAEIKQDGGATEAKAKRLEELEAKAEKQASTQMGTLSNLNKQISEAAKEEQKTQKDKEKTESTDSKEKAGGKKTKTEEDAEKSGQTPLENAMGTYNAQGALQFFTEHDDTIKRAEHSDVVLDVHA